MENTKKLIPLQYYLLVLLFLAKPSSSSGILNFFIYEKMFNFFLIYNEKYEKTCI